jgi:hypothetical protein
MSLCVMWPNSNEYVEGIFWRQDHFEETMAIQIPGFRLCGVCLRTPYQNNSRNVQKLNGLLKIPPVSSRQKLLHLSPETWSSRRLMYVFRAVGDTFSMSSKEAFMFHVQ